MHAEHLGYFLALQSVPRIDEEIEKTLFRGLCNLFTRETVLSLYENTLTGEADREGVPSAAEGTTAGKEAPTSDAHPRVFVSPDKDQTGEVLSLVRKLLELFDVDELRHGDVIHKDGEEPQHMLFLCLIQLLALYVSSCVQERDLATILGVASAVFLEANFGDPLCAATLLKPMFIPHYDQQVGKKKRKNETEPSYRDTPEARLKYYRLFTGYDLDTSGSDVSNLTDVNLGWTEHSLLQRTMGCNIVERKSKKLWFAAPQSGDRMLMARSSGLKMMGGDTGERALRICSYLMSDNVMAYVQCAIFGTISNMLPCHVNSELTDTIMATIKGSMSVFSDVVRHQSANLMAEFQKTADSCLFTTGVGFMGQERGPTLYFGRVFTGPEEKRPPPPTQARSGVFTSVSQGLAKDTMVNTMLTNALKEDKRNNIRSLLATSYKPVGVCRVTTDSVFYARYHYWFNSGEFTEVACVKACSDPKYNSLIHEDRLTHNSKYQLTLSHGALPMCTLTLAMTMRQTVMMIMGFISAELARLVYAPRVNDATLCKQVISLSMVAKFRHKKDEESTNVFGASYGEVLKLTGPVFGTTGSGVNSYELNSMEWLRATDPNIPDCVCVSLNKIGDTRKEVEKIMAEKGLSYNRVQMVNEAGRKMTFASVFANEKFMIHAPTMTSAVMRVFSNNSATNNNSYGCLKLCRQLGSYYYVRVFSNRCVNTDLFRGKNTSFLADDSRTRIEEIVERIKRSVSCVMPRIDVKRIDMMAPGLSEKDMELLLSLIKKDNIEVTGRYEPATASCSTSTPEKKILNLQKRAGEEHDDNVPDSKRVKADDRLTIFDPDMDVVFDSSENDYSE